MDGPLPPTPHMRACLGSWRTMSSYTLATVSAVVSKAQGRTHSLSRDDMQGRRRAATRGVLQTRDRCDASFTNMLTRSQMILPLLFALASAQTWYVTNTFSHEILQL